MNNGKSNLRAASLLRGIAAMFAIMLGLIQSNAVATSLWAIQIYGGERHDSRGGKRSCVEERWG